MSVSAGFSGVVRIGDESWAFGYADRAHAIPNTVDTQFGIASGTKGLTALVAEATLPRDLRARELLGDDLPLIDDRVTVEHLLTHTNLVDEHVLAPAGMRDTAFLRSDALPGRATIGYLEDGRTNVFHLPVRGSGDGGIYTTLDDVDRFWAFVGERRETLQGGDAGVSFMSVPGRFTVISNTSRGASPVLRELLA